MRSMGGGSATRIHRLWAARRAEPAGTSRRPLRKPLPSFMSRWLALCGVAFFLCIQSLAARADDSPAAVLRYDGVYVSEVPDGEVSYCMYLRFYPDGTVLDATAGCGDDQLAEVKQWMTVESAEQKSVISRGKVKLSGASIAFSTFSIVGKVNYKGEIVGNTLVLKWHSYINNQDGEDTHTFKAW